MIRSETFRIIGLSCLLCAVPAQAQHWQFQMYGLELGLTNPTVVAVHQDTTGFVWVSTEGGLFRYDGDRFSHVSTLGGPRLGIAATIHSSRDGHLWAASIAGLFRYANGVFTPVPGYGDVELEASQGISSDATHIYVATPSGLRSTALKDVGSTRRLSAKWTHSVYVAPGGGIWYGCGMALCSLSNGTEREWTVADGVGPGPWRSIAEDSSGRLWIRSKDQVLMREAGASVFHSRPDLPKLNSTRGNLLVVDRLGRVMIPHNAGLMICDLPGCRNFGPESGLRHTEVLAVTEDREGSLWLGFSGHGLGRWLGRDQWQSLGEEEGLTNLAIWRIQRGRAGDLWVGTNRGLFHGVQKGERWRFRRTTAVGEDTVYGLLPETDGSFWVGTFQFGAGGLVRFNPATNEKSVYFPAEPDPNFSIGNLSRDESGTLWIGGPRGVMRLRPGGTRLEKVPLPIDGAPVYGVTFAGKDLIVASKKGLYVQRGPTSRLYTKADGLKDNLVQSVTIGTDGALWISYYSPVGISRAEFQGNDLRLQHFSVEEGLPSGAVYSQFFDSQGRHWLATDSGVAIKENGRWVPYSVSDGFVWNDCNAQAYLTEEDGTVWVGTSGGIARYRPNSLPPPVMSSALITGILRNDELAANYDFDSETHSITIRFSVLAFKRRAAKFRYRLGSSSNAWIYTGAHEVRFAQLPSGSYNFEVQGELEGGVWSGRAVAPFRIRSPWYLSLPAKAGFFLLLASLIWLGWLHHENRQRAIRAALEAAVAKRTRDLAEATARAEQASKCKSEFLANMSHEIRTPMNAILGMTELVIATPPGAEQQDYLNTIRTAGSSLLQVVNDILDFSKIDAGKIELASADFSLIDCIRGAVGMFELQASQERIHLTCSIAASTPEYLIGDCQRLRQVLINLLGNALKFTEAGEVRVEVGPLAGPPGTNTLRFTVSDTGVGVPLAKQALIFDSFEQADGSTTRVYGGTGLGLAISRKLVSAMHGTISVESPWRDSATGEEVSGSAFHFTAQFATGEKPERPHKEAQCPPVRPLRILLAEDNLVNQKLMTSILKREGHTISLAADGQEALELFDRTTVDLILMDIQMPRLDGLETTSRIRERERSRGGHVPIVALTAHALQSDSDRCLEAGMDAYLSKPVSVLKLNREIRRLLRQEG